MLTKRASDPITQFNRPMQHVLKPNLSSEVWHQRSAQLAHSSHPFGSMVQANANDMALLDRGDTHSPIGFIETPQQCLTDRRHLAADTSGSLSHFNLPTARERLLATLAPSSSTQQQAAVVAAIAPHEQVTPF